MIIAAGGKDLHNFIKEANIVTEKQEGRQEVRYQARQEAVQPDANGAGGTRAATCARYTLSPAV